jgi:hypothetical protein
MNGYTAPKDTQTDYPGIRAWGKRLGSYGYYIDAQVQKARETKAPQNAIYFGNDYEQGGERWHTIDEITDLDSRPEMRPLAEINEQLKAEGIVR